jgi:hypothetical protein
MIFLIYSVPIAIFQIFKNQFLRTVYTFHGSLFHAFILLENGYLKNGVESIYDIQLEHHPIKMDV